MRKLTKQEKKSVHQASDLILKIIECYKVKATDEDMKKYSWAIKWVQEIAKAMKEMSNKDKIRFGKSRSSIAAWSTRNGIFVNVNFANGNLKEYFDLSISDFNLTDCEKGRFRHVWNFIMTFSHEYFHYKHHTGFIIAVPKAIVNIIGAVGYGLWRLFSGRKSKSIWNHEREAYAYTYILLSRIHDFLQFIKDKNKDCLPCVERHIPHVARVRDEQNPYV